MAVLQLTHFTVTYQRENIKLINQKHINSANSLAMMTHIFLSENSLHFHLPVRTLYNVQSSMRKCSAFTELISSFISTLFRWVVL